MNKSSVKIILLSVLVSFFVYMFFGRFVAAKVSTLPVFNKWKILSPQAPIVINNREEVRVSDATDVLDAANSIKSKMSAIVLVESDKVTITGSAVNITSDGTFVTAPAAFPVAGGSYAVVLPDGRQANLSIVFTDPATGIMFCKADINGVAVAPLGNSSTMSPGEKVIFAANSTANYTTRLTVSTVAIAQNDTQHKTFDADTRTRGFDAQSVSGLVPGQSAVNIKGEVVGVWNGTALVSSDVIKQAVNAYLSGNKGFARPQFGFTYTMVTKSDAQLLKLPEGARVAEVAKAVKGGLAQGDIITAVNGQQVNGDEPLETKLDAFHPGDTVTFTVLRSKEKMDVVVKVGELK